MAESENFIQIKAENSFIQEYGDFKDDVKRLSRHDKGLVAPGAAVTIKDDNKVTLTTDNSQLKLSPQGHLDMVALQSTARVNREYIKTDEIVLNNHKFNNKILEYADMRLGLKSSIDKDETIMKSGIIGKLSMMGLVLTKAWDPELKRYVLIRRLAALPIFCPEVEI